MGPLGFLAESGEVEVTTYRWCEDYVCGVPAVDTQHKTLLNILNRLVKARDSGGDSEVVSDALTVLTSYATKHLRFEEQLMYAHHYPEAEEHILHHRAFRKRISELCFVESFKLRDEDWSQIDSIVGFLEQWLPDHILQKDKKLGAYLAGLGLEPARLRDPGVPVWAMTRYG